MAKKKQVKVDTPQVRIYQTELSPRHLIKPNDWNPNEMPPMLFNELVENIATGERSRTL